MAILNPNPNIADGIKCDNKTYSSNKIDSLISTAITTALIPAAVVPTVSEGVTIEENASYKIGKLVILNMILKCTDTIANNGTILTDLPVSASTDRIIFIKRNGSDKWIQSTINGSFILLPSSGDLVNVTAINGTAGTPVFVSVNIAYIST